MWSNSTMQLLAKRTSAMKIGEGIEVLWGSGARVDLAQMPDDMANGIEAGAFVINILI